MKEEIYWINIEKKYFSSFWIFYRFCKKNNHELNFNSIELFLLEEDLYQGNYNDYIFCISTYNSMDSIYYELYKNNVHIISTISLNVIVDEIFNCINTIIVNKINEIRPKKLKPVFNLKQYSNIYPRQKLNTMGPIGSEDIDLLGFLKQKEIHSHTYLDLYGGRNDSIFRNRD